MRTGKIVRELGLFACAIALFCAAGCWTVRETPPREAAVRVLPDGKELKVQVAGFDATVTTYETAYGYATVTGFGGPWYDRGGRYRSGFGTTTFSTTEYIPRTAATPVFRDRATDALERAGCIVQARDPRYRVEVRFEGPADSGSDAWAEAGWLVCTIFTADFGAQEWRARLKVHDLSSGKLIHENVLSARDEAVVWGPIPFFSPSCASRTSEAVLKGNCLTALTDLAVADAVEFLSAR